MPTFFNPNGSVSDSNNRGPSMSDRDYEIAALLSQYGPEELEALRMAQQSDKLRNTGAPEMRSAGKLIFAPHAMEYVGNLALRASGEGMNKSALDKQRGIASGIRGGFADLQKKWAAGEKGRADELSGKGVIPDETQDYPGYR